MSKREIKAMADDLRHLLDHSKRLGPANYCDLPATTCPDHCKYYGGLCTAIKSVYEDMGDINYRFEVAEMLLEKIRQNF